MRYLQEDELCTQLHLACEQGEREALNRVCEHYFHRVWVSALARLRNQTDADDVTQTVFMLVTVHIRQLGDPAAFWGWVHRILARVIIDQRAKRCPLELLEEAAFAIPFTDDGSCHVERIILTEECQQALPRALQKMRWMDRQVLELFYLQGRTILNICGELGKRPGTIKRRLSVARERLRLIMAESSGMKDLVSELLA
jgi:RNA polymerase sigma-70 factor, ECF subfamily